MRIDMSKGAKLIIRNLNHTHRKHIEWRDTYDDMVEAIQVEGLDYMKRQWFYKANELEVVFIDISSGDETLIPHDEIEVAIKVVYMLAN